MDISADLTLEDYLDWIRHYVRTSPVMRRRVTLVRIVLLLLLLAPAGGKIPSDLLAAIIYWLPAVAIVLIGIVAIGPVTMTSAVAQSRAVAASPGGAAFVGPRRYVMEAGCFRWSGPHSGGYYDWSGIVRVDCTDDAAYLYVTENSALIVPRRAFENTAAFSAFCERARTSAGTEAAVS